MWQSEVEVKVKRVSRAHSEQVVTEHVSSDLGQTKKKEEKKKKKKKKKLTKKEINKKRN